MSRGAGVAIALSASGDRFCVAVRTTAGLVLSKDTEAKRQSVDATAMLDDLLAQAAAQREDVTEIRVDRGPGSYTGLRMALTFARVLASFTGARLRATTSLELLALAAWRRHGVARELAIRPVLDARRERVHTARLEFTNAGLTLTSPPVAIPLTACQQAIAADEFVLVAPTLAAVFVAPSGTDRLPLIRGSDLFDPALACGDIDADALEPLYLMGTYAE